MASALLGKCVATQSLVEEIRFLEYFMNLI